MGTRRIHDYSYLIERLDERNNTIETIGEMNNFAVAKAAFEAALTQRTMARLTLREGGRIIELVETGLYDSKTGKVAVLQRRG